MVLNRVITGHLRGSTEGILSKRLLMLFEKTAALGINTGAHFIFGLPGETRDEMLEEADIISKLPLTTVKFHQLQIIRGTSMEKEFENNPADFELFTWEEYLGFFIKFLERLNPSIVVERFTGEAPPRFLNGERWGKKRTDQIVSLVEKRLEELDTWQGRFYEKNSDAGADLKSVPEK